MLRVGVCGYGYWGPNLFRVFSADRAFGVTAVAERRAERLEGRLRGHGNVRVCESAEEIIDATDTDVIVVATPAATHFDLAKRALERGKHVFVEKPMCRSVDEAKALVAIAERSSAKLMVDHTFLFHGAVNAIVRMREAGELGEITYYDSLRVNLGIFQSDVNVLWDLAPHDFSIVDRLFDEMPVHVDATGYCHLRDGHPDVAYVTLHFASRRIAHLNLSWMSPVKARRIAIGGSRKMIVWDDLSRDEKVKIYDSGIHAHPNQDRDEVIPSYRIGDVRAPRIAEPEPLAAAVRHFANVIAGVESPLSCGNRGLRNVMLLEASQRAIDRSLGTVESMRDAPAFSGGGGR